MKLKDNENLIVLGLFLGAVGLLSALVLALVSYVTAKPIADAKAAQQRKAMSQVLPAFDNDPSQLVFETVTPSKWQVKFMGAKKDGKLVAVAAAAVYDQQIAAPCISLQHDGVDIFIAKIVGKAGNDGVGVVQTHCTKTGSS